MIDMTVPLINNFMELPGVSALAKNELSIAAIIGAEAPSRQAVPIQNRQAPKVARNEVVAESSSSPVSVCGRDRSLRARLVSPDRSLTRLLTL